MPEPTPADALERMRRQVRAVRWRQNLHELQRALYRLLATLAAAAAALVVLGLLCTPGLFAAAAWGLGAGSVLLAAWIMRALGRRWLSGARAPLWIDRHARLEGRLATALEPGRLGALAPAGRAPGTHPGPALGRGPRARARGAGARRAGDERRARRRIATRRPAQPVHGCERPRGALGDRTEAAARRPTSRRRAGRAGRERRARRRPGGGARRRHTRGRA